jgi:hypothetical protein
VPLLSQACGVNARDEDSWRKCGAVRSVSLSLLAATAVAVLAALLYRG